jgi:hypothetical protein
MYRAAVGGCRLAPVVGRTETEWVPSVREGAGRGYWWSVAFVDLSSKYSTP